MASKKKPDPVADAPKELSAEEIAALEVERAQLAAMVAAGSFTKPDVVGKHVNVFVEPDESVEPASVPAPISVEPEPSMEPVQFAQIIQARQQARDELRVMQDTLDGLSEAQVIVLGDAVTSLKAKITAKLAEIVALDQQIAGAQQAPGLGVVAQAATGEISAGQQERQTTQVERNRDLMARFKEPVQRAEKSHGKLRSFAKIAEKPLAEISAYTYQDFHHWDAQWQKMVIQGGTPGTIYQGGGAMQAVELLQHLRHQLHHVPALLLEVRDFLRAGARDSQDWRLECKDLLRSLEGVPSAETSLEDHVAGFSKSFERIVAAGQKSATQPGKKALEFISPPPPPPPPTGEFKQDPSVAQAQLHPKEG